MRRRIDFIDVIMVLIIVGIIAFAVFSIYCVEGAEVIQTYSVGCEVSQLAYAEETVSRSSSRPVYKMGVSYEYMFNGCENLTGFVSTPNKIVLEATTLSSYCYYGMFQDCRNITSVELKAETTNMASNVVYAFNCYDYMFNGCEKLSEIKIHDRTMWGGTIPVYKGNNIYKHPTNSSENNTYDYPDRDVYLSTKYYMSNMWVNGVADTGTFYKPTDSNIGYMYWEAGGGGSHYGAIPTNIDYSSPLNSSNWTVSVF